MRRKFQRENEFCGWVDFCGEIKPQHVCGTNSASTDCGARWTMGRLVAPSPSVACHFGGEAVISQPSGMPTPIETPLRTSPNQPPPTPPPRHHPLPHANCSDTHHTVGETVTSPPLLLPHGTTHPTISRPHSTEIARRPGHHDGLEHSYRGRWCRGGRSGQVNTGACSRCTTRAHA